VQSLSPRPPGGCMPGKWSMAMMMVVLGKRTRLCTGCAAVCLFVLPNSGPFWAPLATTCRVAATRVLPPQFRQSSPQSAVFPELQPDTRWTLTVLPFRSAPEENAAKTGQTTNARHPHPWEYLLSPNELLLSSKCRPRSYQTFLCTRL
jgi:hypothetical protein